MTLQQLKYLIEVAKQGSFNAAAQELFVSQSTLSMAIKELEREFNVEVFLRSNKGLTLTNEGAELLAYANQVLDQAALLEARYTGAQNRHSRLAISTQHYAFCVKAFVKLEDEFDAETYDFTLRETRTEEIIADVRDFRSDIGILYTSSFNERVLNSTFADAGLIFTPLFKAAVHVFVGTHHPLAQRKSLKLSDLEAYPRYSFEQGVANSFYYAEEPYGAIPWGKNITYSDRGTLTNLLTHGNGFTLSTGVLSSEMQSGIAAIPLESHETMTVGYLTHGERKPSALVTRYIELLKDIISESPQVTLSK